MIHEAEIKTGFLCNNNCNFCLNSHKKIKKNLTTKQLIQNINFAKENNMNVITLTGGEPTIRNDFIQIVDYINKNGLGLVVHTNARMFFYERFVKNLSSIGKFQFLVSIHGHNARLQNFLTQTDSFKQTVKGIKNLIKYGHIVNSNTVINKYNQEYLVKIVKYLISLNINAIILTCPEPMGAALDNFDEVVPKYSEYKNKLIKCIDIVKKNKKKIFIVGAPPCILKDYEEYIFKIEGIMDIEFDSVWKNTLDRDKKTKLKKLKRCKECIKNKLCPGIYKAYLDKYGANEFKPVAKD